MPHFVICDSSQFEKNGSSPKRIGSRLGFCGGPPEYVYIRGCASCRSCMIGGCAVKYQSVIARIDICERLMSRLLSWYVYLPQYGSWPPGVAPNAPPRPPPAAESPAGVAAWNSRPR